MKVIGLKKVDYVSKKGKHVEGWQLYTVAPISNGFGYSWFYSFDSPTRPTFVSDSVLSSLDISDYSQLVNADVELLFNSFGSVAKIQLLK